MVNDLKEDYSKAVERVALKERISAVLIKEKEKLNTLNVEFEALKKRVEKEGKDVEKLEKISLANLIATISGNKESKLEKEEMEYFNAKSELDSFRIKLLSAKETVKHYENKLAELKGAEAIYKRTKEKLKDALINSDDLQWSGRLKDLQKEAHSIEIEIKEVDEVISAGELTLNKISFAEKALSSAENWGYYDIVGGGFISSMIKQDKIKEAKSYIDDIGKAIKGLKKELNDVDMDLSGVLNLSEFEVTFDIWLDNFFTDWSVLSKIEDALREIRGLNTRVYSLVSSVKMKKKELEVRFNGIEEKIDSILISSTREV